MANKYSIGLAKVPLWSFASKAPGWPTGTAPAWQEVNFGCIPVGPRRTIGWGDDQSLDRCLQSKDGHF